jgi:hypothetical protein
MSVWYGIPSSAARACSPSRSSDEIRMLTRLFLSKVATADALMRAISPFWFRTDLHSSHSKEARISCSNNFSLFISLVSQ